MKTVFLERLRERLQEKYGLKDPSVALNRDFEVNLIKILKSFYLKLKNTEKNDKARYIQKEKNRFPDSFERLFEFSDFDTLKNFNNSFGQEDLSDVITGLKPDDRTINNFIIGSTSKITLESRCILSIALGYYGWDDFKYKELNEIKPFDESKVSLINDFQKKNNKNIEILGALVIDRCFIEKVKNYQGFAQFEFYTGKQNENCQWYGVLNNFDVEREIYTLLKTNVLSCFNQASDFKVQAVIYGNGGSGKSTLLRRLAVDLSNEPFKVVWVEDNGVKEFIEHGLAVIENESNCNFLLIIEDWYRIIEKKSNLTDDLFDRIKKVRNVRIVIGDREIKGKDYLKHLIDKENLFLLTSNDNQKIIEKIIENYPIWRRVSNKIFTKSEDYKSSLFLLLFIIFSSDSNDKENKSIESRIPETIFIEIIQSDLRVIARSNQGLAKALYYWACVYKTQRVFITYESFLSIADYFNKDNYSSTHLIRWNLDNPILKKLKTYINIDENSTSINKGLVLFNHDILADFGISEVSFKDWEEFNDLTRFELLDVLIEKADHQSVSVYLNSMLNLKPSIFIDKSDKLKYIDLLIEKNNNHYSYLNSLASLHLKGQELQYYGSKLLKKMMFPPHFWEYFFKKSELDNSVKSQLAYPIVRSNYWKNISYDVIVEAVKYVNNETRHGFYKNVLTDFYYDLVVGEQDLSLISFHLVCTSINQSNNLMIKNRLIDVMSENSKWRILSPFIVQSLIDSVDGLQKQKLCVMILNSYLEVKNITEIDFDLFLLKLSINSTLDYNLRDKVINKIISDRKIGQEHQMLLKDCIKYINPKAKEKFTEEILNRFLKQKDINALILLSNFSIIEYLKHGLKREYAQLILDGLLEYPRIKLDYSYQLLDLTDNDYRKRFTSMILGDNNWKKHDQHLICSILRDCDEDVKFSFCNKIVESSNLDERKYGAIVSFSIEITKNKKKAFHYLKDWQNYDWGIIYACLKSFEFEKSIPSIVSKIIEYEIYQYNKHESYMNSVFSTSKRKVKRISFYNIHYTNILSICFENNPKWSSECYKVMRNWKTNDRSYISNVLFAYRDNPTMTITVCSDILKSWKSELNSFKNTHNRDYLKLSLQHPYLKENAKKTAKDMKEEDEKHPFLNHEYRRIINELIES